MRFEPDHCANCRLPLDPSNDTLFCGETCRSEADTVRYWRTVIRDGRIGNPDVFEALRTRKAFLLVGGYPAAERALTKETKAAVRARDGGLCVQCHQPGDEIDHIAGSSSDLSNLQLLCRDCHHKKTAASMVPATPEDMARLRSIEELRVLPNQSPNLSDDESEWRKVSRTLKAERRARLKALAINRFGEDGTRGVGKAWTQAWLEMEDAGTPAHVPQTPDDDAGYGPGSYFERAMEKGD